MTTLTTPTTPSVGETWPDISRYLSVRDTSLGSGSWLSSETLLLKEQHSRSVSVEIFGELLSSFAYEESEEGMGGFFEVLPRVSRLTIVY